MRLTSPWSAGAAVLLAFTLSSAPAAHAAQGGDEEEEGFPPDGAIEIPFQETGEIRPGMGWLIDCDAVGELEGVASECSSEVISLAADYDPEWEQRRFVVRLVSPETTMDVSYTVRMGLPPAPELATPRFDLPITVGEQAMIPLSALGILCAACTVDGGATLELGDLPAGVTAGVSETHLALRGSRSGDAVIPLNVTDDAGQEVSAEFTVSFVDGGSADIGALHIESAASEWSLADISWAEEPIYTCGGPQPRGLVCEPDGNVTWTPDDTSPTQFLFRVIDADGAQSWGSVTVEPQAEDAVPAAPSWNDSAPLRMVFVPGDDEPDAAAASLLGPLTNLLEGMSGS